ncbi:hypothetical protein F3Y22_tig00111073pilonHSYRG00039 [Hibiscus syriacus]|uniref:Uncharacterized protein n=1 Tax=Hibiscus syriacus TaxID=106335 RepID=A0A6A2Z3A1_HIBSY|nr:hypothetical protein F3Y22_tig00111073pilonHSYRG00039 [Hibiscus syriacus]
MGNGKLTWPLTAVKMGDGKLTWPLTAYLTTSTVALETHSLLTGHLLRCFIFLDKKRRLELVFCYANAAIFPYPYQYTDAADCSLAPEGDLRKYLERLAEAENVQQFIEQNPFGEPAITETDPHWDFYSQIIEDKTLQAR